MGIYLEKHYGFMEPVKGITIGNLEESLYYAIGDFLSEAGFYVWAIDEDKYDIFITGKKAKAHTGTGLHLWTK